MIVVVYIFRKNGVRPECVSVRGCVTRRDVVGIKYRVCFVCVFRMEKIYIMLWSCRLVGVPKFRVL